MSTITVSEELWKHLAFVFSVWPRSQTEEMGCRLPSQMWRADTRGCFSRSGHTSTSRPWGRRVSTHVHLPSLGARAHPAESCIELAPKTRTQNLKDKGAAHALSF